jgi:hypothetical protein
VPTTASALLGHVSDARVKRYAAVREETVPVERQFVVQHLNICLVSQIFKVVFQPLDKRLMIRPV